MKNEEVASELVRIAKELTGAEEFPYKLIQDGMKDVRELRDALKKVKVPTAGLEKDLKSIQTTLNDAFERLVRLKANARRQGV